jgi:hypothetical protein
LKFFLPSFRIRAFSNVGWASSHHRKQHSAVGWAFTHHLEPGTGIAKNRKPAFFPLARAGWKY